MKKIKTLIVCLLVVHILALAGLLLWLSSTGRLDKQKFQTIVDMLRHKGTPEKFREHVYDILDPVTTGPSSQAATQTNALAATPPAGSAEERMEAMIRAQDQERIQLDAKAQELLATHEMLETLEAKVAAGLKKIDQEKKEFESKQANVQDKSKDESFQKTLALYDELKPRQIKDIFISLPAETVAKFLQAMDPSRAGKIIAEYKTPEEREKIKGVLELIRSAGTSAASDGQATGITPGT